MKRYHIDSYYVAKFSKTNWFLIGPFVLMIFAASVLTLISSCKHTSTKSSHAIIKDDTFYTCSMHPQIHKEHPGKCPICQMDLIPVSKSSMQTIGEVHLNEQQIRLGNIQVDTIATGS